jgi:hypothetical protein
MLVPAGVGRAVHNRRSSSGAVIMAFLLRAQRTARVLITVVAVWATWRSLVIVRPSFGRLSG